MRKLLLPAAMLLLCITALARPAATQAQAEPTPEPRTLLLGNSAQGRPIEAIQFGNGPRKLVVVGSTHGAPEANTYRLVLELVEHFRANPGLVPSEVRLFFIPTLNPDGLALGWRFDAIGVDLNRNMETSLDACPENDWRTTVQGAYGQIADTGGPYADSQIEARLIRAFLLDTAGAIFIHSNAGLVFPAFCEHAPSIALAESYAAGSGYSYSRTWPLYNITGGMHDWAASLGIAAITPELVTGDQSEFSANLAGLQAVLAEPARLLPLPADGMVEGIVVPAPIYRYWRALGGIERFGPPLEPARISADGLSQTFRNVRIGLRHAMQDSLTYVQPELLGSEAAHSVAYGGAAAIEPRPAPPEGLFFEATGHSLQAGFQSFWERGGGLANFGMPLSAEFTAPAASGQTRTLQYLERALFSYDPATQQVMLEPLGVRALSLEQVLLPTAQQSLK